MRNDLNKIIVVGAIVSAILILIYVISLVYVRNCNCGLDLNEYGDFIGGILNPIFSLLSTIAIIVLTYYISKRDDHKANEALEIQKKFR